MTTCPIALTDSHIIVGNSSNVGADVAMSGDVSINNAGEATVTSVMCLADFYTDAASTSAGGDEQALYTFTIPGGTLANDGDKLEFWFSGRTSYDETGATEYFIGLNFGGWGRSLTSGQAITNYLVNEPGPMFSIRGQVIRDSSTSVRIAVDLDTDALVNTVDQVLMRTRTGLICVDKFTDLDLGSDLDFSATGGSTGTNTADGDITYQAGSISYIKAAPNVTLFYNLLV